MTIAGLHTINEVLELRAQKVSDVNAYTRKYNEIKNDWGARDPIAANAWGEDWKQFLNRWNFSVLKSDALLASSPLAVTQESAWQILLHGLQETPGSFKRGDFPDFVRRWSVANLPSPDINTKQPDSVDLDLEIFKLSDKLARKIEGGARDLTPYLIGAGVLGLAYLYMNRRR